MSAVAIIVGKLIPLLIFLAVILVAVLLFTWLQRGKGKTTSLASYLTPAENLSYEHCKPLTATEAVFYYRLIKALPDHIILPQVQLCRFIKIKNAATFKRSGQSYALQNRIAQQSVDYLVCLKDFTIVAAVELDDKSHSNSKVKQLDQKKEESLKAAGVSLVRWHAEQMPSVEDIYKRFSTEQEAVNGS